MIRKTPRERPASGECVATPWTRRLTIVDGVARLDLEGDGFSSEGLDEDLHGWWANKRDA